ncbi:PP2C family protein-serine/threonine phosphatase [Actinoplanes sp. L3-i22]|uniref:PP2C family protein-serine/threonine phosphatase n=1 Tax=Actinoplanes sp. L3-i22 TaxID=2836373 RepID=UPI001C78B392|nr:PP2C family protein-serine/threonine phosphatase [Actinoplanes sp. L3-i22]BCY05435.1 hypothetical protein L3i22_005230 [Actinoplanes sp. L3-i22]
MTVRHTAMNGNQHDDDAPVEAGGAACPDRGRDLLIAAYRTLGRSLNLDRTAAAAVRLALPELARVAVLVLAVDRQEARWWAAGQESAPAPKPDQDNTVAQADLPGWIQATLTDSGGARVRPIPPGRWALPDGAEHQGHGVIVRVTYSYQGRGALLLLRDPDQATFTEAGRSVAAEFGTAVNRAVTAAVLYREQAEVAETLRTALLPAPIPDVAGLELASVYRPAREALRIGGDIVHAEPRTEGGVFCVLGDVCGKGVEAAVAGNRLRQSLQVLRRINGQPLDMLNLLNAATFDPHSTEATQFATLIVGVVEALPHGGARLRLAAGGHPPPLVVRQTGTVDPVPIGGMMLGVEHPATFAEATIQLAPEEACVLYTDGVVDAEGGPYGEPFGLRRLVTLLGEYTGMPAALVTERIGQRTGDWLGRSDHDDIAALVIRATPAKRNHRRHDRPVVTDEFPKVRSGVHNHRS